MRQVVERRMIFLFLLAIVLPCSLLLALSLRIMSQERELAEKRQAEERRRLTSQIRDQLLTRLERIKLQEAGAVAMNPEKVHSARYPEEVALLAAVEENHLVLPWELPRAAGWESLPAIQEGERVELAEKQYAKAAESYRQAVTAARDPSSAAYARLLLARALLKAGRTAEAYQQYRSILALPSEVADEYGVPWALYAAGRLLEAGVEQKAVLERVAAEPAGGGRSMAPAAAYRLRDLLEKLSQAPDASLRAAAQKAQTEIAGRLVFLEQALALQDDFPNLGLLRARAARNPEPLWAPYGKELWLVSLGPSVQGQQMAVVVEARKVFASLGQNNIRFFTGGGEGEPLGENLPGLKLAFLANDDPLLTGRWTLQRYFYLAAVLLVVSATLFGAYLLLRDVRREVRLSQMRSQFVSSVSHELKTPLTAIRMFAETLRMGRSRDAQMQTEYLDTIVTESERLTRLINNVLDFSKIEQGRKAYHFEPTSLAETVQATARTIPLAQQGFDLRLEVEEGIPEIAADRDALEQALLNLLTNAVKFSGQSREIGLRLMSRNGDAVIQVTDHGIGISPEQHERIFENFYRAPAPESQRIPGTGLGLAVVAHIVKGHGGRIELESAPGKGSTFSICLPLAREPS